MRVNVLLVNPFYVSRHNDTRNYPSEPLGLLCLATYIDGMKDVEVSIVDFHKEGSEYAVKTKDGWRSGLTDAEILSCFDGYRPDVVGVTCNYTFGAANAFRVAELAKRWNSKVITVLGGAHATLESENIVRLPSVDFVVAGEGERAFAWMLEQITQHNRICVPIIQKPQIEDLDVLPMPYRGFIRYKDYLRDCYFHPKQKPVGTMSTSRGCMFRCAFCSTQVTWGNHWRGRSAQKMFDECLYLRNRYGVGEVAFQDDQLLGSRERMESFCKLAIERKLGMTFIAPPGMSPGRMTQELLRLMRDAGFYRICFSVDVGNEKAARWVKKPVKLSRMRTLVRTANRLGLWTYGTFIMGFPNETSADLRETVRYAYGLGLDFLRFYIAQPHAGTELHAWYAERGLLPADMDKDHDIMDAVSDTPNIKADKLVRLRNEAEMGYMRFFLIRLIVRLDEIIPKLWTWSRLVYAIKLAILGWKIRVRFKGIP